MNHFMRNTLVLSEQIISSKYTNDVPYSVEKNEETVEEEGKEVITDLFMFEDKRECNSLS